MVPTAGSSIEVPIFNVKDLMAYLAVDLDGDKLGMAVIGAINTKIGNVST